MKAKCSEIKVGNRIRNGSDDIDELVEDIKKFGLLQPIGITKKNELVFGGRRLAACKKLEYEKIEVVIVESDDLLGCEVVENVGRKDFTMPQRVRLRTLLKEKEEKHLEKLMAKGIKIKKTRADSAHVFQEKIAKQSGVSYDTAKKEDIIIAFENQSIIDDVVSGELSINKAHKLIKKMKKEAKEAKANNTNILPVEENIEIETDLVEVNNDTYIITITDNYDSLEFIESLSDKIKYHAKTGGISPLTIIETMISQAFKNYTIPENHDS